MPFAWIKRYARNIDSTAIVLEDLGAFIINPSESVDMLEEHSMDQLRRSDDFYNAVMVSGSLVLNDGIRDLTGTDPELAFGPITSYDLSNPDASTGLHVQKHEYGGLDELNVINLSGKLADPQNAGWLRGIFMDDSTAPLIGEAYVYDGTTSLRPQQVLTSEQTYIEHNGAIYFWDETREEWLSSFRIPIIWGKAGASNGNYLGCSGGVTSADSGPILARDYTITSVTINTSGGVDKTYQLERNLDDEVLDSFITSGGIYYEVDTKIDLDAGDFLKVLVTAGAGVASDAVFTIEIAARYDAPPPP